LAATKRILVIQTAFLGDLLLSVPLFKYLKKTFPECEISLVCRKGVGSLFQSLKLVDKVCEIQKKNKESYRQAFSKLETTDFDLLLCPHESLTSALFSRKVKAKKKIAFHKWWNGIFFSETIRKDYSLPESLRQMSLLQESDPNLKKQLQDFRRQDAEWKKRQKSQETLLTPVPDWASPLIESVHVSEILQRLEIGNSYVCLFPGSVWKTKQWTEEGFIGVGQALAENGSRVLVMGGPGEEQLAARVAAQIPNAMDLAGRTNLQESMAILSRASIVVTNDSAGQHLAALVGAPTVAIFGPTVLDFGYRPWNSKASVVEREGLACRPCGKHGHHQCPIGTHECMKNIQAPEVLERIQKVLKANQSL
jgi:heptosyltransferase-2